ncbi:MAG: hypothetical protein Q9228_002227 [Teloschistes exilis]
MAPKHAVILIQDPPGTDKTKFLSILFQITWYTNSDGIGGASSNTGIDQLANTNNGALPEMGSMRYHTYHREFQALRKRNENAQPEDAIAGFLEDEFADAQDAQGSEAFNRFLLWRRPNYYQEYAHDDEGFWAILGSLSSAGTLRMPAGHKYELGGRPVEKVIVCERDDMENLDKPKSRTFVVLSTERRLAESGDAGHSIPNLKLPGVGD